MCGFGAVLAGPIDEFIGPMGRHAIEIGAFRGTEDDIVEGNVGFIHQRRKFAEGSGQRWAVIGGDAGFGVYCEQESGCIGIADDGLWVCAEVVVIDIRQDGVGIVAADGGHEDVD